MNLLLVAQHCHSSLCSFYFFLILLTLQRAHPKLKDGTGAILYNSTVDSLPPEEVEQNFNLLIAKETEMIVVVFHVVSLGRRLVLWIIVTVSKIEVQTPNVHEQSLHRQ